LLPFDNTQLANAREPLIVGDQVEFRIRVDRRFKRRIPIDITLVKMSTRSRERGLVAVLKDDYGYIRCASRGQLLYFQSNQLLNEFRNHQLQVDDELEFNRQIDRRPQPRNQGRQNRQLAMATRIAVLPRGSVVLEIVDDTRNVGIVRVLPSNPKPGLIEFVATDPGQVETKERKEKETKEKGTEKERGKEKNRKGKERQKGKAKEQKKSKKQRDKKEQEAGSVEDEENNDENDQDDKNEEEDTAEENEANQGDQTQEHPTNDEQSKNNQEQKLYQYQRRDLVDHLLLRAGDRVLFSVATSTADSRIQRATRIMIVPKQAVVTFVHSKGGLLQSLESDEQKEEFVYSNSDVESPATLKIGDQVEFAGAQLHVETRQRQAKNIKRTKEGPKVVLSAAQASKKGNASATKTQGGKIPLKAATVTVSLPPNAAQVRKVQVAQSQSARVAKGPDATKGFDRQKKKPVAVKSPSTNSFALLASSD